jgi:hypothetical protein
LRRIYVIEDWVGDQIPLDSKLKLAVGGYHASINISDLNVDVNPVSDLISIKRFWGIARKV